MFEWADVFRQVTGAAIGTMIGGVGAYIAVRIDIATLIAQVKALETRMIERIAIVENSVHRAHERIDRIRETQK